MSTIHDQAMNYVYQQILQRLLSFFSRAERTALQLLIQRLAVAAGGMDRIGEFKVLVTQSGSRDSCYSLAMLRAAQLSIAVRAPATFQLRVATLRWNGTTEAALSNMHRSFSSLFLYDDPRVELLMVDNREVLPFNHHVPLSDEGRNANRTNLLMVGHRRSWQDALELWDDAYLATAEFYDQIARWNNGVDVMISSEKPSRQSRFLSGLDRALCRVSKNGVPANNWGAEDLFLVLDSLGGDLYQELYPDPQRLPWRPVGEFEACRRTCFVDVNDILVDKLDERWPLLSEFLGFQMEEPLLYQSDGEFADPLVTAHLHGIQASVKEGSNYALGVREHLQSCLAQMRSKQLPESTWEPLVVVLGKPDGADELRLQGGAWLQRTFGLNEEQIICLLFAPFVDKGAGLEQFLRTCHPGMLVALPDLHRAMQGLHAPEQVLKWMTDVSGLSIDLIGRLYSMEPVRLRKPMEPVKATGACENEDVMRDRSAEG
ncbi:hypothetical protein [Pseudomonas sp. HMWF021]|uniref:hypothetical protein n=1 Tax=Pseudomonas sp. HMWF021 TaxID=2056857 RepID=UPI000D3A28A2|nr:hypothetical protein [Pseudomonas sp. HMWF021]PTT33552.1 hypothetical protein DBR18_00095 [Pseudomonas sp. HMWF021]